MLTSPATQLDDFNAAASAMKVGAFNKTPVNSWYTAILNGTVSIKVNKTGLTQLHPDIIRNAYRNRHNSQRIFCENGHWLGDQEDQRIGEFYSG